MKLQIFLDMPWSIRFRTLAAPCKGRTCESVMAPAVANPDTMGYTALYKMMLDLVRLTSAACWGSLVSPSAAAQLSQSHLGNDKHFDSVVNRVNRINPACGSPLV